MFVFINYFFIHLSCRWGGTKRQREDDLEKRQIRWIYKADFNLIRHSFGCLFLFLQKEKEEIFLKEKTEKKESNQSKWNEKNVKGRRKNTTWKVEIFLTVYIPFIFLKWNLALHSYLNFFHKNMNLFWWGCALLSNCGALQPQKLLRHSRMLKKPICG